MDKEVIHTKKLKLGIFSYSLLILFVFFYLTSFINKNFILIYGQIPLFTIKWLEMYRLLTGIFISYNFFDLLLNLSIIIVVINSHENQEGTTKTFFNFFLSAILIQIIIISLYFSVYFLFPIYLSYSIKPTVAVGLAFITKHMLLNNEKNYVIYPNFTANNRWLAIIFFVLVILLNYREFKFESLFSFYYGFLICKIPKYFNYSPNEETILHFEKNEKYKSIFNLENWVLIEECFFKSVSYRHTEIENGSHIRQIEQLDVNEGEHLDFSENSEFKLIESKNIEINEKENEIELIA
jgi:hypothetical protein